VPQHGIEAVMTEPAIKACHCCGLVQSLPALPERSRAVCPRCGVTVLSVSRRRRSNEQAAAAALAALVLYPLAISLPIMRVEELGRASEVSVWAGSVGLLREGEPLVGAVVLLCSVVIPLLKLLGLFAITSSRELLSRRHRALTYRLIELAGRWGMLDVLLIAIVVAWVKMGGMLEVRPGPAALTFTLCVLLSLLASARFDPHALWEREAPQSLPSTSRARA
jgi:paraquat-inducible protein A